MPEDEDLLMDLRVFFRAVEPREGEENEFDLVYAAAEFRNTSPYNLALNGFWHMDGGRDYFVSPSAIIGMERLDQVTNPVEFGRALANVTEH